MTGTIYTEMSLRTTGRSIITKKGDGSQVKESTDSTTTLEDDDVKGRTFSLLYFFFLSPLLGVGDFCLVAKSF